MSRIGVIGAMHQECKHFRESLKNLRNSTYLNLTITQGIWAEHEVCLVESGIGKVNATLAIEWLMREFKPELIINSGSAGGIKKGAKIGDFVIAEKVCHHDIDLTPIGLGFGELPGLPVYYPIKPQWLRLLQKTAAELSINSDEFHTGTIASGEAFVYQAEELERIKSRFDDVVACDMEAAAVAQLCHLHEVDCLIVRNLSDVVGVDGPQNFDQFLSQAGQRSAGLVLAFIKDIEAEINSA